MSSNHLHYQKQKKHQENEILEHAAEILANRYVRGNAFVTRKQPKSMFDSN